MGGDVCTNAGDEARENVTNRMDTPAAPPRPHLGPLYSIGSHQLITNNLMNYKIIPMRCIKDVRIKVNSYQYSALNSSCSLCHPL